MIFDSSHVLIDSELAFDFSNFLCEGGGRDKLRKKNGGVGGGNSATYPQKMDI